VGRLSWAEEEFALVARRAWEPRVFDPEMFWTIKGARDLPPQEAAILRELYAMRDRLAGQADLSPFRIVSDETLLALARKRPAAAADLSGVRASPPRSETDRNRRAAGGGGGTGRARGGLAGAAARSGAQEVRRLQARLERLREWRKTRASELGLDPGVLCPQSTLEALAAAGAEALDHPEEIPGLRAWRSA